MLIISVWQNEKVFLLNFINTVMNTEETEHE